MGNLHDLLKLWGTDCESKTVECLKLNVKVEYVPQNHGFPIAITKSGHETFYFTTEAAEQLSDALRQVAYTAQRKAK